MVLFLNKAVKNMLRNKKVGTNRKPAPERKIENFSVEVFNKISRKMKINYYK